MKIRFVQLESDAFLTDIDFNQFSPAEQGVYCHLIFFLYAGGGKCEFDMQALSRMCNCDVDEFEKIWAKISKKFQTRSGVIRHKRVTKELSKAKKMLQARRKAGLKGAQVTWQSHSTDNGTTNGTDMAKERKEKETKSERKDSVITNSNSSEQSRSSSNSVRDQTSGFGRVGELLPTPERLEQRRQSQLKALVSGKGTAEAVSMSAGAVSTDHPRFVSDNGMRLPHGDQVQGLSFHESLARIIRPRSRSDRTCFRNVTRWLVEGCVHGKFTKDVFSRALDFAKEACNGERPAAVFMALLKKELGYGRDR